MQPHHHLPGEQWGEPKSPPETQGCPQQLCSVLRCLWSYETPFPWLEKLDSCISYYFGIHFSFYHFKAHAFLIVMNTMLKLIVVWLVYCVW